MILILFTYEICQPGTTSELLIFGQLGNLPCFKTSVIQASFWTDVKQNHFWTRVKHIHVLDKC